MVNSVDITYDFLTAVEPVFRVALQKPKDKAFQFRRDVLIQAGRKVWDKILVSPGNQCVKLIDAKGECART